MRKGFTLIELMVAVSLFAIIVGIAVGGFANALHTQHEVTLLLAVQSNATLAFEQMAREIRMDTSSATTPATPWAAYR